MNKDLNKIILNRKQAIYVNETEVKPELNDYKQALIATASKNLESLGYRLSADLANKLLNVKAEEIIETAEFLTNSIREKLGGDVEYHPMYPGFPESVLARSDAQLYFDALVYAVTDFEVLPFDMPKEIEAKEMAKEFTKLKTIELTDISIIKEITSNLMSSQVAFSPEDKFDLMTIDKNIKNATDFIPDKIPNKENLTWMAAEYMKKVRPEQNPFLNKIKTPTDLLRLIAVRNGYDSSLTEQIKFKKLPLPEVKIYAKMLSRMRNKENEIYTRLNVFKKINETYHFRRLFKNAKLPEEKEINKNLQKLLDKMYQKDLERSFLSKRDHAIKEGNFSNLVSLYKMNPGQMGADINRLAEMTLKEKDYNLAKATLCTNFRENAEKMSTLNLLKVNALLESRLKEKDITVYSPKKGLSNPYMKVEHKESLPEDLINPLTNIAKHALEEKYAEKRPLGKVYIEDGLKDIKLPSQQRANSKGSTGMSFASQFPIKENVNVLRSFIWWTNSEKTNYVDIDLSASIYDKDLKKIFDISYYNLRQSDLGVHSGDIRNGGPAGGKGVAEFIDINLDKLKEVNGAYVMFLVNIYSGENFIDTPCKFGWMESDYTPVKVFNIKKVEKAIELNTQSTRSIPVLFDVENKKMIWMDRNPRTMADFQVKNNNCSNAITYADSNVVEAYRALNNTIPDLHTLVTLHANVRGEIVSDPKEADTIFSVERLDKEEYPNAKEMISSYDIDEILGDLIPDELSQKDITYFNDLEKAQKEAESIAVHESDEMVI